jgi:hypothetical protein
VAAGIRPYTAVAFGVLAPMFGLGLNGLFAATYGRFPDRTGTPQEEAPAAPEGPAEGGTEPR